MNVFSVRTWRLWTRMAAAFAARCPKPSRRRRGPTRLCLEGQEERQVLSTLFLGGQAPGHFNSFADAYHTAQPGDPIQIEPGAVVSDPSGTIEIGKPITLQGDPHFGPAPVLSSIAFLVPWGVGFTPGPTVLTNLNLGNKDV